MGNRLLIETSAAEEGGAVSPRRGVTDCNREHVLGFNNLNEGGDRSGEYRGYIVEGESEKSRSLFPQNRQMKLGESKVQGPRE